MTKSEVLPKSEATRAQILEAALELFQREGFDNTTKRGIAANAQVATGAAYYYYRSKDAIVMDFYQRSCDEMQDKLQHAIEGVRGLEADKSGLRIPGDLSRHLPDVLWFFQMGVIFFWLTGECPQQAWTEKLLSLACKTVATLVRLSALPLISPCGSRF